MSACITQDLKVMLGRGVAAIALCATAQHHCAGDQCLPRRQFEMNLDWTSPIPGVSLDLRIEHLSR